MIPTTIINFTYKIEWIKKDGTLAKSKSGKTKQRTMRKAITIEETNDEDSWRQQVRALTQNQDTHSTKMLTVCLPGLKRSKVFRIYKNARGVVCDLGDHWNAWNVFFKDIGDMILTWIRYCQWHYGGAGC